MLELKNIAYSYGGHNVIEDINAKFSGGDFVGILGNNGAGKSTLLKCIAGFLKPSGEIVICGKKTSDISQKERSRLVAYLEQDNSYGKLRVIDTVMLGRRPYIRFFPCDEDLHICENSIEQLGISHLIDRVMDELSGGERQKVGLARAISQQTKVLLLDEPTNNLDIKSQHDILRYIRKWAEEENNLAIMVIHDVNLALRYCNKFMLIAESNCHSIGGDCVIDHSSMKDVFGINAQIFEYNNTKMMDVLE